MRWRAFSEELVQGLESLGVKMIILLGALLADAPHTRPVPVSIGSSDAKLGTEIGVGLSDYKGPTGIVGVLQPPAPSGIPTISLWAQVPHYVAQPPSPKATLALLRGVEDVLDVPLPLADLPEEARAWSAAWTSSPSRTLRSPTTCAPWKRPRTRWTCPRRAATRSPASSSATSGATEAPGSPGGI